ncbi:MAG: YihY/virulence factor BrkB family protein [Chitinophagaceae bacterium]
MSPFKQLKKQATGSPAVRWVEKQSKKILLPGFHGLPLYDVVLFFFKQLRKVGLSERTSAISFNFIMAIPPMIIFLATLIPYLPISKEFINQLHALIQDVIPGKQNNAAIIRFIDDFLNKPRYDLLSLGFILAMFFSSNAMMGIMNAFDKNYLGFRKRTGLEKRGIALQLTLILFLLMFASLFLLMLQGSMLRWMGIRDVPTQMIIKYGRWVIIALLFLVSISLIYRHAPFIHKKWRLINPGSVLATTLMLVFINLFSWWLNNYSTYNKIYGPISTVLILMSLIYVNSLVLLIGFELNVSISSLKHEVDERNKLTSGSSK